MSTSKLGRSQNCIYETCGMKMKQEKIYDRQPCELKMVNIISLISFHIVFKQESICPIRNKPMCRSITLYRNW